jgi:hypothetical protein
MSNSATTRPSPSKQQQQQLAQAARKRRHSAISNGNAAQGSDDDDPDEPLAAANPLLKNSNTAGPSTAATGGAAATTGGRKRGAKAAGWNPASVDLLTVGHAVDYRYSTEISQMVRSDLLSQHSMTNTFSFQIYVFCEIQEPVPATVHLIEDIVRGQLIELVRSAFQSCHDTII